MAEEVEDMAALTVKLTRVLCLLTDLGALRCIQWIAEARKAATAMIVSPEFVPGDFSAVTDAQKTINATGVLNAKTCAVVDH